MPERTPSRFGWNRGYWPNTALVAGEQHVIVGGQNVWNRGSGRMVSSKGFGASVANSGGVNPLMNVGNTYGGVVGGGEIVQAFGDGIYFFAGTTGNTAYVQGVSRGVVLANSITIWTGAIAVKAGVRQPGAPIIDVNTASAKGSSHNKGVYSVALTAIRDLTGGESTISPPSNVVTTNYHDIRITALGTMPSAASSVGIYVTKRGFGEFGPYFHLYDEELATLQAGLPYIIQVEDDPLTGWIDGQVGGLAPLDFTPPPPCNHCFVINAVVVAAGCYGGAGLSPSYPNNPDAYPVRFVLFVPGGGSITAVKGSGIEGAVLVCTGTSVNLVTASQSDIQPLNIRPIWPTTGVVSANQIATVGREIFAWVGTRGPVRDDIASEGDPGDEATAFAEPVMKFFEQNGYNASNCVVVYDPASDSVFYVNGTVGVGYCRYLRQWHTFFTFPAAIVTAVTDTLNGRALFSDAGGNLYELETGTGTTWSLISQMQGGDFASFIRTIVGARALVSASCRLDLYSNLDIVTPNAFGTNLAAGPNHGVFHHLNAPDVKSFGWGLSGTDAGGTELWAVESLDVTHPVRI